MTRLYALLFLASFGAGCTSNISAAPNSATREGRVAILKQITNKCHLPESALQLRGSDEVRIQPPTDAKYEDVDCMLVEVRKQPFSMKLGFIGNEAYSEGNSQ